MCNVKGDVCLLVASVLVSVCTCAIEGVEVHTAAQPGLRMVLRVPSVSCDVAMPITTYLPHSLDALTKCPSVPSSFLHCCMLTFCIAPCAQTLLCLLIGLRLYVA